MISNPTLAKIAIYGGVATIGMGIFANFEVQGKIKKSEYFRESMKIVRNHPEVVRVLGEPIKVGQLNLSDMENNHCDGSKAKFEVPLKGSKSKGTMFFWAMRDDSSEKWEVKKLQVKFKDNSPILTIREP